MPRMGEETTTIASCSPASRCSAGSRSLSSSGSRRSPFREPSRRGRASSTRAMRATPATSSAAARSGSLASTPTAARSPWRPSASGDLFGELAMLDGEVTLGQRRGADRGRAARAVADRHARARSQRNPEITAKLVVALTRRVRETNERVARQSFQTVPSRVAGVLSQLVAEESTDAGREGSRSG